MKVFRAVQMVGVKSTARVLFGDIADVLNGKELEELLMGKRKYACPGGHQWVKTGEQPDGRPIWENTCGELHTECAFTREDPRAFKDLESDEAWQIQTIADENAAERAPRPPMMRNQSALTCGFPMGMVADADFKAANQLTNKVDESFTGDAQERVPQVFWSIRAKYPDGKRMLETTWMAPKPDWYQSKAEVYEGTKGDWKARERADIQWLKISRAMPEYVAQHGRIWKQRIIPVKPRKGTEKVEPQQA